MFVFQDLEVVCIITRVVVCIITLAIMYMLLCNVCFAKIEVHVTLYTYPTCIKPSP